MGGGFFGEFFGGAAAGAEEAVLEVHGDFVGAGVVLAFDADDGVAEGVVAVLGLDEFLEAAFGVAAVFDDGEAVGEGAVEGEDDALRGREVAVEVEGADEGFEGVFARGGAGPATGGFFAGAEAQAGVELEVAGEAGEEDAVGEGGAAAAELAFAVGGVEAVERFGEDELEDGVAEEFEALVVFGGGLVLDERGVRDGAEQERRIANV